MIPYDWLRQLEPQLLELDDTPLMGAPPLFPWDALTKHLSQLFEYESFKILPGEYRWREKEHLLSDLKGALIHMHFGVASFEGDVTWVFPEADIPQLMVLLLEQNADLSIQDISRDYQEGFYRFLAVEILNAFREIGFDKTLVPHLQPGNEAPNVHSLCLDISFALGTHTFTGRLVISEAFRHSWKQHYAEKKRIKSELEKRALAYTVTVQVEGGRTPLSIREWKKIKKGDFLLLEQCSLKTSEETSRVLITYRGAPIFIGELTNGKIQLTQSHEYHEVKIAMTKDHQEDEDLEEEMTDEEFDFSLDDEDFKTEESDIETDEPSEIEEDDESELEEDESEIDEEPSEFEEEEEEEEEEEDAARPAINAKQEGPAPSSKKKPLTLSGKIDQIPIPVIVELGRIEMTVEKLLQLQAGNLLELDVHPEDGVDLVMNGHCIGKGELHRIGDALGVRITEIG